MDLNAGIHDGHQGSVPISQSLRAFNSMVPVENRFTEDQISYFVDNQQVPPDLVVPIEDPSYGSYIPLFRRQVGVTRVTIFEGGHDTVFWAGLNWLAHQWKR